MDIDFYTLDRTEQPILRRWMLLTLQASLGDKTIVAHLEKEKNVEDLQWYKDHATKNDMAAFIVDTASAIIDTVTARHPEVNPQIMHLIMFRLCPGMRRDSYTLLERVAIDGVIKCTIALYLLTGLVDLVNHFALFQLFSITIGGICTTSLRDDEVCKNASTFVEDLLRPLHKELKEWENSVVVGGNKEITEQLFNVMSLLTR